MNPNREEEILQRKADLARERLLAVVDELDRKRHKLSHPVKLVSEQLMPQPETIAIAAASALAIIGTVGYVVTKRNAKRRRRLLSGLRAPPPPSFWGEVFTRTAKALVTFGLVQGAKLALTNAAKRALAQADRAHLNGSTIHTMGPR